MSLKEEANRHLRLLGARAEAITEAYTSGRGLVDEITTAPDIVDELLQRRVANRSTVDGHARISSHLISHLDVAMNTVRIRQYGFDIGSVVDSIRESTNDFLKFTKINSVDAQTFLETAEESARALCEIIQDEAAEVWRLILGEFSVVDSMEAKIVLNRARLVRTGRLIDALKSLDIDEIVEFGMADRRLRPLFTKQIPDAVERSRQDLSAALTKLSQMLFLFEKIEHRTGLLKGYLRHLRRCPEFVPQDYDVQVVVPDLFLVIQPLSVKASADIKTQSTRLESQLAEMLEGIRAKPPTGHEGEQTDGAIEKGETQEIEVRPSPVREAIRNLFKDALLKESPLSVLSNADHAINPSAELWLMTAMEEYNSMPRAHKDVFRMEYVGQVDVIFDGNFNATDVLICPR